MENKKRIFTLVIAGLFILNLLQAGFTELLDDEAYYWLYSQHPDWGYYDHPPMVAWMIKAGCTVFNNIIGIRILPVIFVTGCIYIMYKLQKPVKPLLLLIILLSTGLIHYGAIFAVPDLPLVFFTACFLWLYAGFLKKETWLNTLLLGVCMAALLYSKYHGVLLIFFCIMANPKLLLNKKFWIACVFGAILFFPHLYWQYENGFPSLQYHLVERRYKGYHYSRTTDYILGQLFLFGPLIAWMIFYAAFKQKSNGDVWIRTLKWIVNGVLGFFFLTTFKGRIEPNWTVIALIPAILLLHYYLDKTPRMERILRLLLPFSLAAIFLVRAAMIWDISGNTIPIGREFHNNKEWTGTIKTKANDYPVYFLNSFQMASKYTYYQQMPATSYNTNIYRNNQFDLWKPELSWQQDSVLAVSTRFLCTDQDSVITWKGKLYYKMFANPNVSEDKSLFKTLPPRKMVVPFF